MKKLKKNKIFVVLLAIIIVGIIIIFYGLIKYFYLGSGQSNYGDRLQDIDKYELTDKQIKKVKELYKDTSSVGEITFDVHGRIIYIKMDFVENIKLDDAKSLAVKSLEALTEKIKSYYDIQYMLTAKTLEEEGSLFPTMGYKNSSSAQIDWVKS